MEQKTEQKQKFQKPQEKKQIQQESESFNHIVRVMNTDLKGQTKILDALRKIKGVSFMLANAVCEIAKIEKTKRAGDLSNTEVSQINSILETITQSVPTWMLNRRKDYETGQDKHLYTSDLDFEKDNDLKRLKKIKSYRGYRHAYGLPVRGQRTKSNFRKNKGKVQGVKRKGKPGKA